MAEDDSFLPGLQQGRQRFLALVGDMRAELHRYCARMTGSVSDGEDIVQETLASAYFMLSEQETMPPLRPWLFRIAHNRAIDHLRRYERRMSQPLDAAIAEGTAGAALDADDAIARDEAVRAAISRFSELPPAQRGAVILKDVLGHSLQEIATILDLSVVAIKAALHRGRVSLNGQDKVSPPSPPSPPREPSPAITRYAALFNARDWDGVRGMLADDVKLNLVSRVQRRGRRQVGEYVTNYAAVTDWHLLPARMEGREVIAVFRTAQRERPDYFIELSFAGGEVIAIRDFRYVDYIGRDAMIEVVDLD